MELENFLLPEFLKGVEISFDSVESSLDSLNALSRGVLWEVSNNRFLLNIPNIARYLVEFGKNIIIDACNACNNENKKNKNNAEITRFLKMTPLAALILQKNFLAFHASVVVPPKNANYQGAILIAGDSGAGKSVLTATLLQKGWQMLSDELSVINQDNNNGGIIAFPMFPEILLWSDAFEKLKINQDYHINNNGCYVLNAKSRFINVPQVLKAIIKLSVHNKKEIEISKITGSNIFSNLGYITYNSHIADAILDKVIFFKQATAIINKPIPMYRLYRPRITWDTDKLINKLISIIL